MHPGTIARVAQPAYRSNHIFTSFCRLQHVLRHLVTDEHFLHCQRVIQLGSPQRLNAELRLEERYATIRYGNHPGAKKHPTKLDACLNKDERNNHSLSFPAWAIPFFQHTMVSPLSVVVKQGKKDRVIADSSFRPSLSITTPSGTYAVSARSLNDLTDIEFGHFISYANVVHSQLEWAYLLRLSRPTEPLFLVVDDVAGAFKNCVLHPDVIGAFGCLSATGAFFLMALHMIFGKIEAPSEYMIFGDLRAALAEFLLTPLGRSVMPPSPLHDIIHASPQPYPDATTRLQSVEPDSRFKPLIDLPNCPQRPFVDDTGCIDTLDRIFDAHRASIQALLILIPASPLRPPVIAFDKLHAPSERAEYLGFIWDLRTMRLELPPQKLNAFLTLLQTTWGPHRKGVTPLEAATLIGILRNIAGLHWWLIYLGMSLQASLTLAIRAHLPSYLEAWRKHLGSFMARKIAGWLPPPSPESKSARQFWSSRAQLIFISKEIRLDIDFLTRLVRTNQHGWSSPIASLIKRDSHFDSFGDACGKGIGSICHRLRFVTCIQLPAELQRLTNMRSSIINDLELLILIVQYIGILAHPDFPSIPSRWPIVQFWTDNMTARKRIMSGISNSPRSRSLLRIFLACTQTNRLAIRGDHIAGVKNVTADYLSRNTSDIKLTFAHLFNSHQVTRGYGIFHPPSWLLTLIWQALLAPLVPLEPIKIIKLRRFASKPSPASFAPFQ